MPSNGSTELEYLKRRSDARKRKKAYWMNKGCTEKKAEELIERYGY